MSVLQHRRPSTGPDDEVPNLANYRNPAPRSVAPTRVRCAPGTSRIVVDELTAAAKSEAARLPLMPFRPVGTVPSLAKLDGLLAEMRTELDNWNTVAEDVERKTLLVAVEATRQLDIIANPLVLNEHMLFVPLFEALRDTEREVIDGVAEWIEAKAYLAELCAGVEETGAEAAV